MSEQLLEGVDPSQVQLDATQQTPQAAVPTTGQEQLLENVDPSQVVLDETTYGSPTQKAITALEGAASGLVSAPVTAAAERMIGIAPEDIERRRATNPNLYMGAQAATLVAPAILTFGGNLAARAGMTAAAEALPAIQAASKFTQSAALEALATGAMQKMGVLAGEGAGAITKVGSAALKGAIENMAFQSGEEVAKQVLHPDFSADAISNAIHDIGGAGLIGGLVSGGLGGVGETWRALIGSQTAGMLNAIVRRAGGAEEAITNPVHETVSRLGLDLPPEIMAPLSQDPELKRMASILNQSDTSASGKEFQETVKQFQKTLEDKSLSILGKDPATVTHEFSTFEAGSKLGNALADKYDELVGPAKKGFEQLQEKFGSAELGTSVAQKEAEAAKILKDLQPEIDDLNKKLRVADLYGETKEKAQLMQKLQGINQVVEEVQSAAKIPTTKDVLLHDLSQLADSQRWRNLEEVAPEFDRVMKRIPELRTLRDLAQEQTTVRARLMGRGPQAAAAASDIISILREAEANGISKALGETEGVKAQNEFNTLRGVYANIGKLKDQLDERLGLHASIAGYGKALREEVKSDASRIFARLSGKNDASLLPFLEQNFPEAAAVLKQNYIDQITAQAARKAAPGAVISRKDLMTSIEKLETTTPELSKFAISPEQRQQLEAINQLADAFHDATHNFSNSGRTIEKLLGGQIHSAVGLASGLMTHNPAAGLVVGYLVKALGKDAPDAVRLGLLKMLGSNKPIDSVAFKALVDFAHSVQKGEKLATKAVAGVFEAAGKVIPAQHMATERDRKKIEESLNRAELVPAAMFQQTAKQGYYMPEMSAGLTASAANVTRYLASIKPKPTEVGPLNRPVEPSVMEKAAYERALNIAAQPLTVLEHIKTGTLLPSDVAHLRAMYPMVYNSLAKKLTNQIIQHKTDKRTIPFHLRQSLSLFLGEPLDHVLKPQSIQSIQATFVPQQAQRASAEAAPKVKHSTAPLGHLPKEMMTASQARETRRNK